jgi:hypothetical protein
MKANMSAHKLTVLLTMVYIDSDMNLRDAFDRPISSAEVIATGKIRKKYILGDMVDSLLDDPSNFPLKSNLKHIAAKIQFIAECIEDVSNGNGMFISS